MKKNSLPQVCHSRNFNLIEKPQSFESRSVAGVWDQLPEARQAKPLPALTRKIRDRHARKVSHSIRLAPEQIAAAKHIAAAKSVSYQTQLRMWIAEGIRPKRA